MIMEPEIGRKKTIAATTCSTCSKDNTGITDPERGEIICNNCGTVISEKLEDTSHQERSAFIYEADRTRTGAPYSLARHDMGLSTIIGKENKDASGQIIDLAMRSKMERLRTWNHRSIISSSGDRNLIKAFGQLDRLKEKLGLSATIVEKAAYIYRRAQERGLIKGRTIDTMLAAAVYSACRETETPRTIKDIAAVGNIRRKNLARNYRTLVFELDIKIPIVDPMKCIARVANRLKINEKTKYHAVNIMEEVVDREINAGKEPIGLAATVLYASSIKTEEKISQKDIAAASGVTEVTIRNRFKDLRKLLESD
jgi:transcription initiation factor TFIIB